MTHGIHVLNYIDDWLILGQSEEMVIWHQDTHKVLGIRIEQGTLNRTEYCGFSITEHHFSGSGPSGFL